MSNIIKLPGLIDIHVHLRDPGQTHKEDFFTGTSAALSGGVTTIFDMPNNLEPIFTSEKLMEKINIAKQKAVCDWGLYLGTDGRNTDEFEKIADKVIGLKLYLSLTTGKYVVADDKLVELVFKKWPKSKVLVVHAESDRVDLVIRLATRYQNKLHITHVSTKDGLEKIIDAKKNTKSITCDTTPHYLMLSEEYLREFKGLGIVKPPLATPKDQEYLWQNLNHIDCIASDHAPHTLDEKQSSNPPAGLPGVETMLPLLAEEMSVENIIRLTNINPRKIFGLTQDTKTYVEIDKDEGYKIKNEDLFTKCGWSPFDGWEGTGKVKRVFIRGMKVFEDGKILVNPGFGKNVV
ncbi:amidohydrolase family protein [Candidatus Gottesmanbacteria bacterium]|nr:amidohydrolase family protein [Candidatus Gottesmanbacteria bacterium]